MILVRAGYDFALFAAINGMLSVKPSIAYVVFAALACLILEKRLDEYHKKAN